MFKRTLFLLKNEVGVHWIPPIGARNFVDSVDAMQTRVILRPHFVDSGISADDFS